MIDSPLAFPSGAYGHPGMTLRDYFAAAAMQELLARDWLGNEDGLVSKAYEIADLMVKARGE